MRSGLSRLKVRFNVIIVVTENLWISDLSYIESIRGFLQYLQINAGICYTSPRAILCAFSQNHSKSDVCSTGSTPVGGLRSLIFHCFHGHPTHKAEPDHMSVALLWACAVEEGTVSGKGNKALGSVMYFTVITSKTRGCIKKLRMTKHSSD
jgi:hypothetical protein